MVIRGLDIDKYGDHDSASIFLGISSYIAETRGKQDRRGSMISRLQIVIVTYRRRLTWSLGHVLSNYQEEKNDEKGAKEMVR